MYALGFLLFVSILLAGLLTPVVRDWCLRRQWVDLPDQQRKLHRHPVPRMGGLVLALSYLLSFLTLLALPFGAAEFVRGQIGAALHLLPAAAVVLALGLLDDRFGLPPFWKLTFEVIAAALAFHAGVQIGAGPDATPWWSFPATVFWLVTCANAFNLIDGVDGLAAGVGLFATLTLLAAAVLNGNATLALAVAPLAGALFGFLRYNFEPASIYLGDSGSLTIGFLLGCFGIIWSYKSATVLGMAAPLILFSLPFLDVLLSVVRRFLAMKPIFGADRGHIHHRLLALGLRPRHVALVLYCACALAALCSLLATRADRRLAGFAILLFAALAVLAISRLGFAEFRAARRALTSQRLRRLVHREIEVERLRTEILAASSPDEFWRRLRDAGHQLGFESVSLRLADRSWTSAHGSSPRHRGWQTRVPLNDEDYAEFSTASDNFEAAQSLIPLALALRQAVIPPEPARATARAPEPPPEPVASMGLSSNTTPR